MEAQTPLPQSQNSSNRKNIEQVEEKQPSYQYYISQRAPEGQLRPITNTYDQRLVEQTPSQQPKYYEAGSRPGSGAPTQSHFYNNIYSPT